MTARISLYAALICFIAIGGKSAFGQQPGPQQRRQAYAQAPASQGAARQPAPTQPRSNAQPQAGRSRAADRSAPPGAAAVMPQNTPTLQRRTPQSEDPRTLKAPFQLSPAEQAEVDEVLKKWKEASEKHKRIHIEFFRHEYKPAFQPKKALHIDHGEADFSSEGKWRWKIHGEYVDGEVVEGQRAEQMVFDGNSIYEFNYPGKTVTQHILAKDMQGEEMVKAMLPFLFGTDLERLKERYFIRLLKYSALPEGHVCIDASPRFLDEARNYKNARMILDMSKMEPTALKLTLPNGTDSYVYEFEEVKINPMNPLNPLDLFNDPFKAKIPSGWSTHVQQMAQPQVSRRPDAAPTR